jgi:phospholipase C
MRTFSRRSFLQIGGATLAATMFPPSIRRALAIPARVKRGTIMDVEHVVILMQENRSFDHYFGTLSGVRGFGDRITIPLPGGRSVWEQQLGNDTTVLPYHLDSSIGNAQRVNGTPHGYSDAQNAWAKGSLGHWPQFKLQQSMSYYEEVELPFQFALANAFTVCDAYHCSFHGGTNPNRLFMFTGMNDPFATGGGPAITNQNDSLGLPETGFTWTTYAERLEAAGVSWKVYQDLADNFSDNSLAGFRQYREPFFSNTPSPLVQKGLSTTLTNANLDGLRNDVMAGALPQVSWVVAPAAWSEHPGPSSPVQGGWYTQEVLNALTADPDVFAKTVLLVMFDENDGYFDHVPPPCAPSLRADLSMAGASTVDDSAERYSGDGGVFGPGPRVPMTIVSPWSRGGWVDSQAFDHTSLIRFVEERFGVTEPNIGPWRRAVLGDLTSAFDFRHPNRKPFPQLPQLTKDEATAIRNAQQLLSQVPVPLGNAGTFPVQATGFRPSRALPYELHVDAEELPGGVHLTFRVTGAAAAVFQVYDRLDLGAVPRRYTVEPGKTLDDTWPAAATYDLWVMGPNGFLRHVQGALPAGDVEVQVDAGRKVSVRMINDGGAARTFVLTPNAYKKPVPREVRVEAGKERVRRWPLSNRHRWYDFTVTCAEVPGFSRRFAGRAENGKKGISDPAMGT